MCIFSPQKFIGGPSPHLGTAMQTPFSPLSFDNSFMKIRSAIPENGCLVFLWRTEKAKIKKQKTSVKHIRIRLIGGCVKKVRSANLLQHCEAQESFAILEVSASWHELMITAAQYEVIH